MVLKWNVESLMIPGLEGSSSEEDSEARNEGLQA
jgi:hypothetical protein